jgi:hypothetical protein
VGSPKDRYLELLFDKVRSDRYPSGNLLDRIEVQLRSHSEAEQYLELLYEKIENDRYPSGEMLDRIHRGIARISA